MRIFYSLRIETDKANYDAVSALLNVKPHSLERGWIYEVTVGDDDPPFDFIERFTSILEGKMEGLRKLDIEEESISIWMIYEYHNQCNMEFTPKELGNLSSYKITLCISCYEEGVQ